MDTDTLLYRSGLFVGILAVLGGLVMMVSPGLAQAAPFLNIVTVALVAAIALVMGLWLARLRLATEISQTVVPDPEFPMRTPSPGNDVDRMLHEMIHERHGTLESRNQIRDRLGEVATQVIMHEDDCTREQALLQLQEGTWTDNPVAAAFFQEDGKETTLASTSILGDVFSSFGDDEHPYKRRVQTVVDAIVERAGMTEVLRTETEDEPESLRDQLRAAFGADEEDDGLVDLARIAEIDVGDDGELVADGVRYRETLETNHWTGVTAFALVALGVGFFTSQPAVLLGSAVAATFAGYSRFAAAPELASLSVTRQLSDSDPSPGDEVEVSVTVENTGSVFLPDLRVVDRVPSRLHVSRGTPRLGTSLRPGDDVTFRYTLVAKRGEHSWPVQVIGRDLSGAVERDATFETDEELSCFPRLRTETEMPVRSQTSVYAGQVNTETGGSGLEFFSVREFQQGDPLKRVNWKHFARTGELATIDFRQEKAATVVLLFDARESAYVSSAADRPHAVDRSVEAANDVFASLYDSGDLVGVAAFDTVPCWLGPSAGDEHLERARRLFANHPALSSYPPVAKDVEGRYVDPMTHIRRQLPTGTQIMLFSPLTDDYSMQVARRLDGAGHLVTVISPDPTASGTAGERMATVERAMRINTVRKQGLRVVDWGDDRPLRLELQEAMQRW